jgi:serine/threonine protein kinase
MAVPTTPGDFLALVRKSKVVDAELLDPFERRVVSEATPFADPQRLATAMIREGLLSYLQAGLLLKGRWRNFILCGKYKILEHLGTGGMGQVFLCEHARMRRLIAVKILSVEKSVDQILVERFTREARTAAALNHPNIVRAYDLDQEGRLHFIVMEYVDGTSLHDIVVKHGPFSILRACHYIRQAALGLQHAHEHGLVHRDIKPANLLLERSGLIKVHDLGLALCFHDPKNITQHLGGRQLIGTADYLAPEQAIDSHAVTGQADIYSLGGTFYFLLTGRSPFPEGTVAQKLLHHQKQAPDPVQRFRPEVPAELNAIIQRMLAKDPRDRYQHTADVVTALDPWTQTQIPPPKDDEIPRRSRAVRRIESPATPLPVSLRSITPPARSPSPTPIPAVRLRRQVKLPVGLIAAIVIGLAGAATLYGIARLTSGRQHSEQVAPAPDAPAVKSPN